MTLQVGKIYTPSSAEEIRDDFLADWRLEGRKWADPDEVDRATRPGGDPHILATAVGNLGLLQYANIAQASVDADERTASGAALDAIREALGLPEVPPSPSTGRIIVTVSPSGATATFSNHEFVLPNGKRARVDGVFAGVGDQAEVPIVTIDTGADTELKAGQKVRFVSPPPNVAIEAKVSPNAPFTGGADVETDERKRDRIANRRKNLPSGGNWAHAVEVALNALASLQYAFVYPALGGPGSSKVVLVRDYDDDNFSFTRSLSAAATAIVRAALHAAFPDEMEIVVGTSADQLVDVALGMTLPLAAAAGGSGLGWTDTTVWPNLTGGQTKVTVTGHSADGSQVTVDALTAVAPTDGQTHVLWWSSVDRAFQKRLVVTHSGSSGAWVLNLDAPLVDHNNAVVQNGEYVSPASVNALAYGSTWRDVMRRLGPGENTADSNRIPRALRHPFVADDWNSGLTFKQLRSVSSGHDEVTDVQYLYRSATVPTVPGSVDTAPDVFVPRHFGIYQL